VGYVLCRKCLITLREDLASVGPLLMDVEITVARMSSRPERLGGRVEGQPLAYDADVAEVRNELAKVIRTYSDRLWLDLGERARALAARYLASTRRRAELLANTPDLGSYGWAPLLAEDLTGAVADMWSAIDRPASTVFVGWCPNPTEGGTLCGRALYVIEGEGTARCPGCDRPWDVAASRAALLADATDVTAPAATISAALGIPSATIRAWKRRGKLAQAADSQGKPLYSPDGRPLYRLSDVSGLQGQRKSSA
jgi:hypothetical protein